MEFGFGSSLVDKFEDRIGKKPTSALLWLAAIAAFVICINTIIIMGILPIIEIVRGISSDAIESLMVSLLIGLAAATISGAVFVAIVRSMVKRAVVPLVTKAQALTIEAEKLTERAIASTNEMTERLEQLTASAEARSAQRVVAEKDQATPAPADHARE